VRECVSEWRWVALTVLCSCDISPLFIIPLIPVYTVVVAAVLQASTLGLLSSTWESVLFCDPLLHHTLSLCGAGRDYICVQSMDGQLSFYEQDHASFTRQLERCLIPGPMCYVAKTDSIVISTCEMTVESYKYVECIGLGRGRRWR
jgi:hypothetical protein